jgi:hypothetical protein
MLQYHDLLIILAYCDGIRGRSGRVDARGFLRLGIQNSAVPGDSIRGGDDTRRGLLTRRTAVAAQLGIEIRKRRDRR